MPVCSRRGDGKTAPPVKNWRILLERSLTAHMPLLTATSAFDLERRC